MNIVAATIVAATIAAATIVAWEKAKQASRSGCLSSLLAVTIVTCVLHLHDARAETPFAIDRNEIITLPVNPADTKGYTVDFAWDQQSTPGYMAIDIRVNSTSTFAADGRMTIRLEPSPLGHSPPQNGMTIDIPVTVEQGKKQQVVKRMIPKWSVGNGYQLKLLDAGVERETYRAEIGTLFRDNSRGRTELLTADLYNDWLIVCEDENRETVTPFFAEQYPIGATGSNFRRIPRTRPAMVVRQATSPGKLPKDWRELQQFDAVVMESQLVKKVRTQEPERFAALRAWVLCGGTIIIFNASSLGEITSSLGVADAEQLDVDDRVGTIARALDGVHWQQVSQLKDMISELETYLADERSGASRSQTEDLSMSAPTPSELQKLPTYKTLLTNLRRRAPDPNQARRIWLARAGAGQVVGLAKAARLDAYDLTLVAKLFGYRQSPILRRGVDPLVGDQRAGRWLIPGVAEPPVYTFIGLLTLFTILVGPVAYRMTMKQGRGYLMFAIAPILAIATTATLLIYGVMSDGFGTQTRIRQMTWVDGVSGDAGERIRGTYFAGLRPADGIEFSADAEVMAYPNNGEESWETLNQRNDDSMGPVLVSNDRQLFGSAYLPSRSQKQFVVHRPRRSLGRLKILPRATPAVTPRISSEFDFDLFNVVVHDRDGNYWSTPKIDARSEGVSCNRSSSSAASKALGKLYNDHRPVSATREVNQGSYSSRTRDLISILNRSTGDQGRVVTDGVFELWLQQQLSIKGELPKGYFVALAKVSEDVVWVKGAENVASVRYVVGTLP